MVTAQYDRQINRELGKKCSHYKNGSYSHQNVLISNTWETKSNKEKQAISAVNGGFSPLVFGFYQAAVTTIYCMYIFNDYGWNIWAHVIGGLVGLWLCWCAIGAILRVVGALGRFSLITGFILDLVLVSGVTAMISSIIMFFWHHN
ncbi:hypothetical protein L4C38_11195 [Vibrio kasasachensis]|uniref:hypothetical protein n=1 Tax=Vibrio kasasachensis TaxID=2910248 RepID=UPI003D0F3F3C